MSLLTLSSDALGKQQRHSNEARHCIGMAVARRLIMAPTTLGHHCCRLRSLSSCSDLALLLPSAWREEVLADRNRGIGLPPDVEQAEA